MATFRQRKGPAGQKVWHMQVRRRGWPPQTATFDKKSDAEGWAFQVESEMKKGAFVSRSEGEGATLRDALDRYEREILPRKTARNQVVERNRLRSLQCRRIALSPLTGIGGKQVADHIREREAEGAGPNTIRLDLATISHLYTVARTAWGMPYLTNPVPLAKTARPRLPAGRTRRLKAGEEKRLLAVSGPGFASIVRFALATAMRRGEMASLRWEHVNLKRRSAHLPVTKNGEPRTVPLSMEALTVLKALPRRLDGVVFGVRASTITWTWRDVCKKAGIEGLTFHDLRHEAISRLFENTDLDAMEIARISGHKTLSMLSRYTHLRAHHLAERMDGTPRAH